MHLQIPTLPSWSICFTRKSNENVFSWPLKACPLKWGAQSRISWNIYLQTVYIIKNNIAFYSSCSKQNFNMQCHPVMSEKNKKKIKTTYRVTIVNPDVSSTHRPMLHIFPINPRCLTVFLIHRFHRLNSKILRMKCSISTADNFLYIAWANFCNDSRI